MVLNLTDENRAFKTQVVHARRIEELLYTNSYNLYMINERFPVCLFIFYIPMKRVFRTLRLILFIFITFILNRNILQVVRDQVSTFTVL